MGNYHRRLVDTDGSNTSESYASQTNFDTNMVIILAALLCALIFALGLNTIVRCALRCSHRFARETADQATARLKKRALRQIPVAVYRSGGVNIPGMGTECPICLGEFAEGEKVRVLPKCNHGFHVSCIDTWLMSHSSCPNCRLSLHQLIIPTSSRPTGSATAPPNTSGHQVSVVLVVDEAS